MKKIVVGKHTLESLTTGMYADPFVIYREYIQNAADAIDAAVENGILKRDESEIIIDINVDDRSIMIYDNGLGVKSSIAEKTLVSIGNSKKKANLSRGFRGIGRLSALSYCGRLIFETSYYKENSGTRIVFDADKLSDILLSNEKEEMDVSSVLKEIYTIETFKERVNKHYFRVIMEDVNNSSGLLVVKDVMDYISQNAPVPYDAKEFAWGKEITKRLGNEGYSLISYSIKVNAGPISHAIYKPYKDSFLVDKSKNLTDSIHDIEIVKITDGRNKLSGIGWIGKTNYRGSIYDRAVKGIRLRKGNIQIGDGHTLNSAFKDARFNGWAIGEIFASDLKLIPNARRDNFEKNETYFAFMEQVTGIASGISKDIRSASVARNTKLSGAIEKAEEVVETVDAEISKGVSGSKKGAVTQKIKKIRKTVSETKAGDLEEQYYKEIAFEELDMLIGRLQGATNYKAINTLSTLTKTEKKILERVFNVIVGSGSKNATKMIELILDEFSGHNF